ncbi:hypothetical protein CKF54_00480 [Psittacicella hinzii]|uniref:Uncharacterized protein n=1 Tax=Psittacicella hinzii TaxID=2028575 RepID=A0A3A1YAY5_9GAMM|nr:hypothetical protein [Psittacicella hinzii]RIY34506.1 hypothetical protein CKF54_00480 [Psittacicella hinzii]
MLLTYSSTVPVGDSVNMIMLSDLVTYTYLAHFGTKEKGFNALEEYPWMKSKLGIIEKQQEGENGKSTGV